MHFKVWIFNIFHRNWLLNVSNKEKKSKQYEDLFKKIRSNLNELLKINPQSKKKERILKEFVATKNWAKINYFFYWIYILNYIKEKKQQFSLKNLYNWKLNFYISSIPLSPAHPLVLKTHK